MISQFLPMHRYSKQCTAPLIIRTQQDGKVFVLCQSFVDAAYSCKPEMLQKPKFHLLLHSAESMIEFSTTSSFNTER